MAVVAFLEKYEVIISLVSGLVLAVTGYLFGKWDTQKKSRLELGDRDYKKSAETHDRNVQSAREYVDSLREILYVMGNLVTYFLHTPIKTIKKGRKIKEFETQLIELLSRAVKQGLSIENLDDSLVLTLCHEFKDEIYPEIDYLTDTGEDIIHGKQVEIDTKRLDESHNKYNRGEEIITEIIARLDALAQKATKK